MKRHGWSGTAAVLVAALLGAALPAAPARAEAGDDSAGAAIAVGLMVAVVVVYGLVSLRSDVERYTQADPEAAIARAAQAAEESPIVLHAITAPIGLNASGAGSPTEVAGAGVGWRVIF
ncbi:MAG: hypothetical protein EOM72_01870 [Opitutae bacterium]|nr:hypothetical protein [Opitutae bacterium]